MLDGLSQKIGLSQHPATKESFLSLHLGDLPKKTMSNKAISAE
jgi:hypothetical protein